MSNEIGTFFQQSELALAAYAQDLFPGITGQSFVDALKDAGMSPAQASRFARDWSVVDQYTHSEETPIYDDGGNVIGYGTRSNGLTATVFERGDQIVLAIRGTEPTDPGDIAADLQIMSGVIPTNTTQYQSLRAKVIEWLGNEKLKPGFSVTGHSLGGFLAATLSVEFAPQISHVYLYNAPGFGGTLYLDVGQAPDASLISNIKSAVPFSPIAGLGRQVQPIIAIAAENQFAPDIPNPPISFNHDQSVLTDALSVAALYAELNPGLSVDQANWLLQAASSENARTLESALDALRGTLLGAWALKESPTPLEDREALHWNIDFLRRSDAFQSLAGSGSLRVLQGVNPAELAAGAQADFGLLVALQYLLPIAIEGAGDLLRAAHADLYTQWVADQAVEPEDRTFTENWLKDRAAMLLAKIAVNTTDDNLASPAYFKDVASNTVLGGNLFGLARRTVFGAEGADNIEGGGNEDRLLGDSGDDELRVLNRKSHRWSPPFCQAINR